MKERKNILILPRWYPNVLDVQLGTFIQKQAILLRDDFDIMVIYVQAVTDQHNKFQIKESNQNGIVERIIYFKQNKGPFRKIINAKRYKKGQKLGLKSTLFQPDLCHVHVPYRSAFLALELKRKSIPFVITEHWSGHINGEFKMKNSIDKNIYKRVLAKAQSISTVSELLRENFKANTGYDSEVIPNLIERSSVSNQNQSSDKINILTVSDLIDTTKNISGLFYALKRTVEKKAVMLNIIGGGPDEKKLKKLSKELDLNEHVNFLGRLPHDEVLQYYNQCNFYICNSNFETFGMAVAEALMAGKPVISTICGGPNEYLHEKNAIQIRKNNPDDLHAAINGMCENYTQYSAEEIKEEITAKFGSEIIRKKWINFYNKAINDPKSR